VGRPKSRSPHLDGVLVIDKPSGWTSQDVVAKVRGITGQRRAGHTGTLDPDATGVLVICLGRATRLVRFLQAGRKTYRATMVFGRATSTQDAAGDVLAELDASHLTEHDVALVLGHLVGELDQVPPMVSAVKVDGVRLHELARRGEEVERAPRRITVHALQLEAFVPGELASASFEVTCSAGTYVRTLSHDAGATLGVGGSLTTLRRTVNGAFADTVALELAALEAAVAEDRLSDVLVDVESALSFLPTIEVDVDAAVAAAQGKPVAAADVEGPWVLTCGGRAVGVFTDVLRAGPGGEQRGRAEVVLLQPAELQATGAPS